MRVVKSKDLPMAMVHQLLSNKFGREFSRRKGVGGIFFSPRILSNLMNKILRRDVHVTHFGIGMYHNYNWANVVRVLNLLHWNITTTATKRKTSPLPQQPQKERKTNVNEKLVNVGVNTKNW